MEVGAVLRGAVGSGADYCMAGESTCRTETHESISRRFAHT